jgi:hypothetical protein
MTISTYNDLILKAARAVGILGIGQTLQTTDVNTALDDINLLLSQWNRKDFMPWDYQSSTASLAPGQISASIGPSCSFNIPRISQIKSAYSTISGTDYVLELTQSYEDYANIVNKSQTTTLSPQMAFFQAGWPTGTLYLWPQPTLSYSVTIVYQPVIASGVTLFQTINLPPEYYDALYWALAVRLCETYNIPVKQSLVKHAEESYQVILQANEPRSTNKLPFDTATFKDVIIKAATTAGVFRASKDRPALTLTEFNFNNALNDINGILYQWNRKRWMVWDLNDFSTQTISGQTSYTIGNGGNINVPRPAQIKAAYVRLLTYPSSNSGYCDFPLKVTESYEDYAKISFKKLQSFPTTLFYQAGYPLGTLYLWPVPIQLFELHVVLTNSVSIPVNLNDSVQMPPEYQDALYWNTAMRISSSYGIPVPPDVYRQAMSSLQTIRKNNTAIPKLQMPGEYASGIDVSNTIFGTTEGGIVIPGVANQTTWS